MEWRIFVPRLLERDATWMRAIDFSAYESCLQRLESVFTILPDESESRTDRYMVGFQHFGLKNRVSNLILNTNLKTKKKKTIIIESLLLNLIMRVFSFALNVQI